ncbi:TetR/AcrR family transcriptional regulator [Streptomyces sp. TRM66268-LWL]|uniref:TetR/AcrR family transcriptional regulator n=1 Tax=Streptomyces polyasparticus TaxID=2767826 RepID=A0ABR7SGZ1_9ACTN|nr:TetR/AcrR family transcriptional regulator [Streptomyces polyasparticus]MBC9713756.1 TetR/AcrR family transcriptional regulator [Streptomyces polyasparticus]
MTAAKPGAGTRDGKPGAGTRDGKPGAGTRGAGRPRSAEKDAAILKAALDLLASHGYTRMSLSQVAEAAQVSKSTIHLRWKTKADLLTAALAALRMADAPAPSGDTRAELIAILEDFAATVERVRGMALIGTCLAEEAHTPELLALLRERTVLPRRALLRQVLEQARERGEILPDADLEGAVSALLGPYYADYMAASSPRSGWARAAVDLVLAGLRAGSDTR